jgi:hypothetical protein
MAKYERGAENKKLEEIITYLPVLVFLIDLATDDTVATFDLDYGNYADRKRIGRITAWAVMNNHSVETMNRKDAEPPYIK